MHTHVLTTEPRVVGVSTVFWFCVILGGGAAWASHTGAGGEVRLLREAVDAFCGAIAARTETI